MSIVKINNQNSKMYFKNCICTYFKIYYVILNHETHL